MSETAFGTWLKSRFAQVWLVFLVAFATIVLLLGCLLKWFQVRLSGLSKKRSNRLSYDPTIVADSLDFYGSKDLYGSQALRCLIETGYPLWIDQQSERATESVAGCRLPVVGNQEFRCP